jgi:hypothetical protein
MTASLTAVLVLLGLAVAAPEARACDAGAHVQAARGGPDGGRAPLVIGDSTMIFAAPVLGRLGLEADAKGCRGFAAGIGILASRKGAGTLPRVAVLALGANGGGSTAQIDQAVRVLGPSRVLGVVTPRNSPSTTAAMRAAAARRPDRVLLIDWVAFSAGNGGWFGGDGLHVSHTGAEAYARLIRRRVAPIAFPPAAALDMPGVAATRACGSVRRGGRTLQVNIARGGERILCRRALELARRPALRPAEGWRSYDWRGVANSPWNRVLARQDHEVLIGIR